MRTLTIIRRYNRLLPVSDPERGMFMAEQQVLVVYNTRMIRYQIIQEGGLPVPEFPQSIYPPKLYTFLEAIGYRPEDDGTWHGVQEHHGVSRTGFTGQKWEN